MCVAYNNAIDSEQIRDAIGVPVPSSVSES